MQSLTAQRDPRLDRLWELLPTIHRRRDAERGGTLRALLEIIAEQALLIEDDIGQRYEDWFIETCAEWAVPYIGELVGVSVAPGGDPPSRRTVAHAIANRRQKGTPLLLERLASEIGGWPARAFEYGASSAQSQSLRLPQPLRGRLLDMRDPPPLLGPRSAFDQRAHGLALGGVGDHRRSADVTLSLWRLRSYPVTRAPAACLEDVGPHVFTFSALGNDVPLFVHPEGGGRGPASLPVRIDRHILADPDLWGTHLVEMREMARSVAIWAPGWPNAKSPGTEPIPFDKLIVADLEDWNYVPPRDHLAIDPLRGRLSFNPRQFPRKRVTVSYHYGFSADIGGGEYVRPLAQHAGIDPIRVAGSAELRKALDPWAPVLDDDGDQAAAADQPEHALIEITDSDVYSLPMRIMLGKGNTLQIRAAQGQRPVLRLVDWQVESSDSMQIGGDEGARLILDGLLIAGRGLQVEGKLASLTIRHATLVPGWSLGPECDPKRPSEPSILVIDSRPCIRIEHSIVGSIQVNNDEVATDPMRIEVSDSIVDATGVDCDAPECEALGAAGSRLAFADACFARSTVIGRVMTHSLVAENSILLGRITVARRQLGWMRFCHVAAHSRTPRRFHCQPDLAEAAAKATAVRERLSAAEAEAMLEWTRAAVRPRFDSLRYGKPEYARLSADCPAEIAAGADDGSEMGVFHHLRTARRLASLAAAVDDHMPAGLNAAILLAD